MASSTPTQRTYPPTVNKITAAEIFAVTPRTIDRWLRSGALPADAKVVIGGSVRFRTAVLMDHINGATTADNDGVEA